MANKFGKDFSIVGGVALVKGRLKHSNEVWEKVEPIIDNLLKKKNLSEGMQFTSIGLLYLYGEENDLGLCFQKIHRTFKDLPVELQLNMEILEWADQNNLELLHDIFMIAALEAMIQAGEKYKFPTEVFKEERKKYGCIPDTLEDCKEYKRPYYS